MDELQKYLKEAFHTYQVYLECTMVNGNAHVSLLKWPDIAEASLAYASAVASGDPQQISSIKQVLRNDMIIAMTRPIEVIHENARQRIKEVVGALPPVKVSQEGRYRYPIPYKNDLIKSINQMFATLSTMTEVEYPHLIFRL